MYTHMYIVCVYLHTHTNTVCTYLIHWAALTGIARAEVGCAFSEHTVVNVIHLSAGGRVSAGWRFTSPLCKAVCGGMVGLDCVGEDTKCFQWVVGKSEVRLTHVSGLLQGVDRGGRVSQWPRTMFSSTPQLAPVGSCITA